MYLIDVSWVSVKWTGGKLSFSGSYEPPGAATMLSAAPLD